MTGRASIRAGFILIGVLAMTAGCRRSDPKAPPEIYYGQDVCDTCGMIISDERYAAAVVSITRVGPSRRLFDDVGEMLRYNAPEGAEVYRYVHDAETKQWTDAESAVYLVSDHLHTPMAEHVAAFATNKTAQSWQKRYPGKILDYPAARAAYAAPGG